MSITQHYAGDDLTFTVTAPDYPTADGWTLRYALSHADVDPITFDSVTNADGEHEFSLTAAQTLAWPPKIYVASLFAIGTSNERRFIERVQWEILADPVTAGPQDYRTHAEKVLAAIEAAIEGEATDEQLHIVRTLHGSAVDIQQDSKVLLQWRGHYANLVAQERDAQRIANGLPTKNVMSARL